MCNRTTSHPGFKATTKPFLKGFVYPGIQCRCNHAPVKESRRHLQKRNCRGNHSHVRRAAPSEQRARSPYLLPLMCTLNYDLCRLCKANSLNPFSPCRVQRAPLAVVRAIINKAPQTNSNPNRTAQTEENNLLFCNNTAH